VNRLNLVSHPCIFSLSSIRLTQVAKPASIDMQEILVERDLRIQHNITVRIGELERLMAILTVGDHRMRAIIELKALKLLTFQRQVNNKLHPRK